MKITRQHLEPHGDRYRFDFGACHVSKGYAQIDTTQDASYFGQWANPMALKVVKFQEGDLEVQECETPEEFAKTLEKLHEWTSGLGYWLGIDTLLNSEVEQAFRRLGLARLFHP